MTVDVSTDIEIDRALADVAAYASDPDNAPVWYVNIQSMQWQTTPPLAIGSKFAFVAHFLGRRLAYVYEAVEFEPMERMVMRTADGPFPMETSYTWQAVGKKRTKMSLRNRGEPTGFSGLVAPFMQFAMRRANNKDLVLLKEIIESQPLGS